MRASLDRSFLLFLLSPWLCLVTVFRDVYHRKSIGFILLAGIFGVLSYLYVPMNNADKSYYFNLHQYFIEISFGQGVDYIRSHMTDVVFYTLILIFATLGLSFSLLSGLVTFFTVFIVFKIYEITIESKPISRLKVLLVFLMLIGTFSLPTLFSGIRFYLGTSFALLGIHLLVISRRKISGTIALTTAVLSHFAMIGIALPTIIYLLAGRPRRLLLVVYIGSFYFALTGGLNVMIVAPFLDLDPRYLEKFFSYTLTKEFVVTNAGHETYLFFKGLWFYLVSCYALFSLKTRDNPWQSALLLNLVLCNLTFSFPWVFNRLAMLATPIFVFAIIYDISRRQRSVLFGAVFFPICICTTALDVWIQRDNFANSFFRAEAIFWPTLIVYDPQDGKTFDKGSL